MKENYTVRAINAKEAYDFILNIHYAKRIPSISKTFGLFLEDELVGIVTYGTPSSSTLRRGIAGDKNIHKVTELNRLVLKNNLKNEASILVGKSLKMLDKGLFVVSFADSSQNHLGIVYQATNFKYYGLSAKRTDWALKSKPHLHGQTIGDLSRGQKERAKWMRETYGDDFYLKPRPRKHRYIFVTGKDKSLYNEILYKEESYPK